MLTLLILNSAGVPQVVVPCWFDTLDCANRVEWLGVGVYGSRSATPSVEAGELFRSIMRVLGEGEQALGIKQRARELAIICNRYGGRRRACDKIIAILERNSS
jgi:UDP:flavonoid glycosyltransferase YjiC (YdhE family)